jgi:hypothetical protein
MVNALRFQCQPTTTLLEWGHGCVVQSLAVVARYLDYYLHFQPVAGGEHYCIHFGLAVTASVLQSPFGQPPKGCTLNTMTPTLLGSTKCMEEPPME